MSLYPLKNRPLQKNFPLKVMRNILSNSGYDISVARNDDNTVALSYYETTKHGHALREEVETWKDIVMVDCAGHSSGGYPDEYDEHYHSIAGLKKDGTVLVAHEAYRGNKMSGYGDPQKFDFTSVQEWKNIVQIAWGSPDRLYGLKNDGSVIMADGKKGITENTGWGNVVYIYARNCSPACIKKDGSFIIEGKTVSLGSAQKALGTDDIKNACKITNYLNPSYKAILTTTGNVYCYIPHSGAWSKHYREKTKDKKFYDVYFLDDLNSSDKWSVALFEDGYCEYYSFAGYPNNYDQDEGNWTNIYALYASYGMGTIVSDVPGLLYGVGARRACGFGKHRNYGGIIDSSKDVAMPTNEYTGLAILEKPLNLLDKTKVKGFTISGVQPANTNRKVAFKVDNKWNKLTTEGALSPLPTQAITSDSVLAEGNTVSELTALTNVPSLSGKLVYPAIALYAGDGVTVMPTFGMTVKAEIDTTVDVYTKTSYSQEFVLHNELDVLIKSVNVDSDTKGNGKLTLKARYATFDEETAQIETWSNYVDLLSVINKKCHKLQIKADYRVSTTDGSDSATLNDVTITYAKEVVAKSDGTTDLVTLTQKFTNDLTYVHTYIKHKKLIDADLRAYVRLQKTPKKAEFKLIGYGTGARKTYKVIDEGINQDSLMVYVNGKAVYNFDFNTETSEITLVADVDVPINATYEFGWELFNYVEMQKGVSQVNDSGAYTTEYSYTIPEHEGEYTVTAIKYELLRPEGKVTNEVIGVGTGKRQIIQLPHYARKETIVCNGKWSYDYDSKRLTVIAPADTDIVISYDWSAESPQVYAVMAGWAD